MNKIKITSMQRIQNLEDLAKLEHIALEYGFSYYNEEGSSWTTVTEDSKVGKLLSEIYKEKQKIIKQPALDNSRENILNQLIISEILDNANFIAKQHPQISNNLHIQINTQQGIGSILAKTLIDYQKEFKEIIEEGINTQDATILSKNKKMFLGVNVFKEGNQFADLLIEKLSLKELVSFVFLHEYSHMAEVVNNENIEPYSTSTAYDKLRKNINLLWAIRTTNDERINTDLENLVKQNSDFESAIPSMAILSTLKTLHGEMYADISSLLLIRNKNIIDANYNEEKFLNIVNNLCESRTKDKNIYLKKDGEKDIYRNSHYTTPAVESLTLVLKGYLHNDRDIDKSNVLLSNEQIHEISQCCMHIGISKTLLAWIEIDPKIIPQLKTIFSFDIVKNDNTINSNADTPKKKSKVVLNQNQYEEINSQLINNVPENWYEKSLERVSLIKEQYIDKDEILNSQRRIILHHAMLDSQTFYEKLSQIEYLKSRVKINSEKPSKDPQLNMDKTLVQENISHIRKTQKTDKSTKENKLK